MDAAGKDVHAVSRIRRRNDPGPAPDTGRLWHGGVDGHLLRRRERAGRWRVRRGVDPKEGRRRPGFQFGVLPEHRHFVSSLCHPLLCRPVDSRLLLCPRDERSHPCVVALSCFQCGRSHSECGIDEEDAIPSQFSRFAHHLHCVGGLRRDIGVPRLWRMGSRMVIADIEPGRRDRPLDHHRLAAKAHVQFPAPQTAILVWMEDVRVESSGCFLWKSQRSCHRQAIFQS